MVRNRGRKLEDDIIKDLGAKPHKNSGAMAKKLDGSDEWYSYEIKTTSARQYILKHVDWQEVNRQAIQQHKEPIEVLVFDNKRSIQNMDKIVIMDYEHFKELKNNA